MSDYDPDLESGPITRVLMGIAVALMAVGLALQMDARAYAAGSTLLSIAVIFLIGGAIAFYTGN